MNDFVISNICIYVSNTACNMRSVQLKSRKSISHNWRPTTTREWFHWFSYIQIDLVIFRVFANEQRDLLLVGTGVVSSNDIW